ncbi:hypothetical protein TM7_0104 [candidate division TM7 genomosp. GTL1]|nr:hypothetical protein TM7_0104 [candidate division TM7 genomosp. GTL1]
MNVEHNNDGTLKTSGSLASKVDTTDSRLSDARAPTVHASTHADGGSDPVTPVAIGAVTVTGGGKETAAAGAASGANTTVNLTNGNVQVLTLNASTTLAFSGATNGAACSLSLYLKQDATGSRVITWPSSVKWPNGVAPTLSTGANKIDLVVLETLDGGINTIGNWLGALYRLSGLRETSQNASYAA